MAFFRSAPTPLVSRVTIASFQAIVRTKSSLGGPIESPIALSARGSRRPCAAPAAWIKRLRGNAADVETRSAEPVGFDEDRVEAELAGADRGDIAARAAADDENLAAKLVHFALLPAVIASGCEAIQGPRGALRSLDCFALRARNDDRLFKSLLDEQRRRRLDQRPQALDEGRGVIAVDHPMIERRRQVHDFSRNEAAVAPDGLHDDLVDADDRDFRPVDDRRRDNAAEAPRAKSA